MSVKKTVNIDRKTEKIKLTGEPECLLPVGGKSPKLTGRREIFTNELEITDGNVLKVLQDALTTHMVNRTEIIYLEKYLRGDQPVRYRVKDVRPEICNKIVINRANEIVTFKTANFIGEPLQYVSRGAKKSVPKGIEDLNSMMLSENKHSKDMQLAYWMFTCGIGYRLTLRDKAEQFMGDDSFDEAPFEIYTLVPRNTFVVKANDVTKKAVMGVTFVFTNESEVTYTVYTKNKTYYITGSLQGALKITRSVTHNFGKIPIVEYPCNSLRMGAFEVVIDLLDAINLTESNRLDGVEQFIQALMVFENVDITNEQFSSLREQGGLKISSQDGRNAKVYYLNEQLDQGQTQTLVDAMYQEVLQIVGMPSQGNANTSDSSNNGAVIMKNGWWNAEARAKETEGMWREAETDFLKIILKICRDANAVDLKISDIQQKFFRRSYEDLLTKVQSFQSLIGAGCPPIQAYTVSSMVIDPESEAIKFEEYQAEKEKALNEQLKQNPPTETIVTENADSSEVTEEE